MKEKFMRYGQFIRSRRLADRRELSQKDLAEALGVSVTFLCDIENGRRKPLNEEKTQKLIKFLRMSEADIAWLYDLAARENERIPKDLGDVMMYTDAGDMARYALRMTKKGLVDDDDWRVFIKYIDTKETSINA